ncbi:MAG: hypothetical protein ACR2MM_01850, partial [Flavobacteriaceae bacterium]
MRTLFAFFALTSLFVSISTAQMSNSQLRFSELAENEKTSWLQNSTRDSLLTWQEKVFLHLSNDVVFNKSRLFFKGYLLTGPQGSRSNKSKVLKVELLNENAEVVKKQYHPIEEGLFTGNIQLPKKLKPGKYYIRAYTRWMQNYGESSYTIKSVYVSSSKNSEQGIQYAPIGVLINPEGGSLLNRQMNRLVMSIDQPGDMKEGLTGLVTDQN